MLCGDWTPRSAGSVGLFPSRDNYVCIFLRLQYAVSCRCWTDAWIHAEVSYLLVAVALTVKAMCITQLTLAFLFIVSFFLFLHSTQYTAFILPLLTLWCPLLPYGFRYKASCTDQVKPSFVIFDVRTLWRSGLSVECPDVKNYKYRLTLVWHRMLYIWTHMATVDIKGLKAHDYDVCGCHRAALW